MTESEPKKAPTGTQRPVTPVPPQSVTVMRRRGPNTAGCIATLAVALLIGAGLIAVGLFLPPFNLAEKLLGPQFVMVSAASNAVAADGLTLVFDPEDPGRDFGVALTSVASDVFLHGSAPEEWVAPAKDAVPPMLTLVSPVYDIATTGTAPESATFDIALPPDAPLDLLDVYGFDIRTNRWRFLSSQPTTADSLSVAVSDIPAHLALFQAGAVDPTVVVPVDITQELTEEAAQLASIVTPAGLTPNAAGQLPGSLAPGFVLNAGYRVMPLVRNFDDPRSIDVATVQGLIGSAAGRRAHVEQLVLVALSSSFDGVFIDYRGLPDSARDDFSVFIAELKQAFSSNGLLLGVVVPQAANSGGAWETGAYDWRAIGAAADYVEIDFALDPLVFAAGSDRLVEATLRWATREVSRYKLLASLMALSLRETNGALTPITYREALARLGSVETPSRRVGPGEIIRARLDGLTAQTGVETLVQAPYIVFQNTDGSPAEKVWLTTGDVLQYRFDRLTPFMIGGAVLAGLTADGLAEGVAETVLNYKLSLPVSPSAADLALRWRVQDNTGVLAEVTTGLNEELVVTLEGVEGNVAINAEVVDGQQSVALNGMQVAVLRATSTPTPLPTAQNTLVPTITPSLSPILHTATPRPGFQFNLGDLPAVQPGPGSIRVGMFEYGGQVTGVDSQTAIGAMRAAQMTWMKIQVRYRPGNNPDAVGGLIQTARGNGFKILVSAVGEPSDLAAGGGGYIEGFASYLGGLANYGPDAIEVWNEPNISREWPAGQISGANYAAMLGIAYARIKASSSGTMVISAAPAPTGGEGAFAPGEVRNDDAWLLELKEAGGLQYADCIGVHYNEGIVPPDHTSGDPRDDYYTRYFGTMIGTYSALTDNKPLCFTELGYLSPEGYGAALAENFMWGSQTTVGQQAAWLAQAIAMASQSGKVRLLIVWNVDFTRYDGNDPQGGYAIIRPGGGCPACGAIAAAR